MNRVWRIGVGIAVAAAWIVQAGAAGLAATVRDGGGNPIADAVIYAVPRTHKPPPPETPPQAVIDQVRARFTPFVTAVRAGTEIVFPNADQIGHNVYSLTQRKTFELPLSRDVRAPPVRFDEPGVAVLGCNIHDWMVAYVMVLETPYFGVTDATGATVLRGLPVDSYDVWVWHPGLAVSEATPPRTAGDPGAGRFLQRRFHDPARTRTLAHV